MCPLFFVLSCMSPACICPHAASGNLMPRICFTLVLARMGPDGPGLLAALPVALSQEPLKPGCPAGVSVSTGLVMVEGGWPLQPLGSHLGRCCLVCVAEEPGRWGPCLSAGGLWCSSGSSEHGWAESSVTALEAWTRPRRRWTAASPTSLPGGLLCPFSGPHAPLVSASYASVGGDSCPVLFLGPLQPEGPETVARPGGGTPTMVPRVLIRSESAWPPALCFGRRPLL